MGLVLSMTGYGRTEARGARSCVTAEVRSLNHRFLEANIKLPRGLTTLEPDVRRQVQGRIARGRVDVTITLRRIAAASASVRTDVPLGLEYARGARALAAAAGLPPDMSVGELLRLPGVTTLEEIDEEDGETAVLLKTAVAEALDELGRMRQTEGAALARDLGSHVHALGLWVSAAERLLPAALARVHARLRDRVQEILGEAPADAGRLA